MPSILDVLILYLCSLLYVLYAGISLEFVPPPWGQTLFSLGIGLLPLVYARVRGLSLRSVFPLALPKRRQWVGGLVLALGMFVLVYAASGLLAHFAPGLASRDAGLGERLLGSGFWIGVLNIALLPALCEEVLCRGFILSGLRNATGRGVAIVLCGALFGLLHMDPLRIPFTMAIGIGLSYAAWETRSVFLPLAMHGLHNFALLYITKLTLPLSGIEGSSPGEDSVVQGDPSLFVNVSLTVLFLLVALGGGLLIRLGARLIASESEPEPEPESEPESVQELVVEQDAAQEPAGPAF